MRLAARHMPFTLRANTPTIPCMDFTLPLMEQRCICHKLLFKGEVLLGFIEIKCKTCGKITSFQGREPPLVKIR